MNINSWNWTGGISFHIFLWENCHIKNNEFNMRNKKYLQPEILISQDLFLCLKHPWIKKKNWKFKFILEGNSWNRINPIYSKQLFLVLTDLKIQIEINFYITQFLKYFYILPLFIIKLIMYNLEFLGPEHNPGLPDVAVHGKLADIWGPSTNKFWIVFLFISSSSYPSLF